MKNYKLISASFLSIILTANIAHGQPNATKNAAKWKKPNRSISQVGDKKPTQENESAPKEETSKKDPAPSEGPPLPENLRKKMQSGFSDEP